MATGGWWMFHGDAAHSGEVAGSSIRSNNVGSLILAQDIPVAGPVLSVPALVDGIIYVGIANTSGTPGVDGGTLYKIDAETGTFLRQFNWSVPPGEGDTHGFMGMGCTPAVANGSVIFSAFDGKLYCIDQDTFAQSWVTDLRRADLVHNQPVNNVPDPDGPNATMANAAGWSSPLIVNDRVYVGMGEGENPDLFGFVYCLDATTGDVLWIYCTCLFEAGIPNPPNVLPASAVPTLPPGFSTQPSPATRGCSIWSCIAYDEKLDRLFMTTGNPAPDSALPSYGFSNGILSLDATTGEYCGFFQAPAESSYRQSDNDVDFGGSAMLFDYYDGTRVVAAACKNGSLFVLNAATMDLIAQRQLLPYYNDGSQIPTVDPHIGQDDTRINPYVTNEESNATPQENFYGTYSTPAVCTAQNTLYIGVGGNNYHNVAAGIDCTTTPFMRALNQSDLSDAWQLDDSDPQRYIKPAPPMYAMPGEGALSSPVVVNDVVFCSTNIVALHAFSAIDGTALWSASLGDQTGGINGGYGYCLGPAIENNFVVVGALVSGGNGGLLHVYTLATDGADAEAEEST